MLTPTSRIRPVPETPRLEGIVEVKRMRHDEGDVANVQFEQLSLAAVDLAEAEELTDAQALDDEEWLWEEPEFVLDLPASEQEFWEARTEEVRNLT